MNLSQNPWLDELRAEVDNLLASGGTEEQRIDRLIKRVACICGIVAMEPLPVADALLLSPIQGFMCYKIGVIKGFPLKEKEGVDLLKELAGILGLGMLAKYTILGLRSVAAGPTGSRG